MIKMSLPELKAKIIEKSNLTDNEIDTRIEQKLKLLSGLISKEGAAHIIANELGIKLFEPTSGKLQIKNILTGMRDVETIGRVQQIFPAREFQVEERTGKVGSFTIADETSSIRVVCWGAQADNICRIKQNDAIKIVSGYVRENRGIKEVHINEKGKVIINPDNESIGEIKLVYNPPLMRRKSINELSENENNIELFGTIVQLFEPRFFNVCPECNRKLKTVENNFFCDMHNAIETPKQSYVVNAFLDDGSEAIRVVFFSNLAEKFLKKTPEQMLEYNTAPEKFEELKSDIMGMQIKVSGRTVTNQMFNKLEFIANSIDLNPNVEHEIERLNKEIAQVEEVKDE